MQVNEILNELKKKTFFKMPPERLPEIKNRDTYNTNTIQREKECPIFIFTTFFIHSLAK